MIRSPMKLNNFIQAGSAIYMSEAGSDSRAAGAQGLRDACAYPNNQEAWVRDWTKELL